MCSHYCVIEDEAATCRCNIGYALAPDNQTCIDVDECSDEDSNKCSLGSECHNTYGSYLCICPTGSALQNDERTCKECDPYHYGPNCSLECSCLNGVCDSKLGCICYDGWTGTQCKIDIDECQRSSELCPGFNRACVNTRGGYQCRCQSGFETQDDVCGDIDECSNPDLNKCDHVCSNTVGSFKCLCHHGYRWNGSQCVDLNECAGINVCDQFCENTDGGYRCYCDQGFSLNQLDRRTCDPNEGCSEFRVTECLKKGARCIIRNHVTVCDCGRGFQMIDGKCTDIKECHQTPAPCSHTCVELPGSFYCSCPDGYHLDEIKTTCRECTNWTYGPNCTQLCNCDVTNTKSCDIVKGTCSCKTGWKGDNCRTDVNECSSRPCPSNSQCVNTEGSYNCDCQSGYIKTSDGQCEACPPFRHGTGCTSMCNCSLESTVACSHTVGTCLCRQGWQSVTCTDDVDECSGENVCGVNQYCVNSAGSYLCMCKEEYIQDGGHCRDPCEGCSNGGSCDAKLCGQSPDTESLIQRYIIYGSAGGGVVILIVAMATGIVCLRRRNNRRKQNKQNERSHSVQRAGRKTKQRGFDSVKNVR